MEALSRFFEWFGANEAVLSGIAAGIVILGVLLGPLRRLLRASATRRSQESGESSPAPAREADAFADSPSIAVLPFVNLSGDAEQEFLADGLTEDIILGLSRYKQLFVIARNTCFTYKGRTVDAREVSDELGVGWVLEGSVRRAGDRIRVNAQLVEARSRTPRWSEHFDRRVEEILDVDDEVTEAIVTALQPALRRAEAEAARRASPDDLTAWALVNRAWVAIQSDLGNVGLAEEAIQACNDALARDPDYAFAHAVLAHAKSLLVHQPEPAETRAEALASIRKALELGPDDPLVHHCHAALLGNLGRTEDAIHAWERSLELDPNNAGARAGLGISRIFRRQADAALELIDGALRRSPADPLTYHWLANRALAQLLTGRPEAATRDARAALQRQRSRLAHGVLAISLALLGRDVEAAEAWREFVALFPGLDTDDFARLAGAMAPDEDWGREVSDAVTRTAAD